MERINFKENPFKQVNLKGDGHNKVIIQSPEEPMNSNWLSLDETCRLLRVSKRSCQNYRDRRLIPFYQFGRKIIFKASEVDEFLEKHHIKANYQKGDAA